MLAAQTFTIAMSYSCIDTLIIMQCSSLSLTIFFIKHILSEIRIATQSFFWFPFASLYFQSECVSRSEVGLLGSCFCIHSVSLYLLVAAFNPSIFKVIIDKYVPTGIFLIVLGLFCRSFFCVYLLCKSLQYLLQDWLGGAEFS